MPDSVARRRELAKKGQMGCPKTLNYPLDTKQHVKAAVPYYKRDDTVKCQGFWPRWCKAAKRVGHTKVPTFKEKC
jgi:hypothetical protein